MYKSEKEISWDQWCDNETKWKRELLLWKEMEKVEQQSVMENLSADAKREWESFYSLKNLPNKFKIKKCFAEH